MPDSKLRTWKSTGPRPCKRCKTPISLGDRWYSGLVPARLCASCGPIVEAGLLEAADTRAHQSAAAELTHRRAVRQARREGAVL